jgi:hypothetical protein
MCAAVVNPNHIPSRDNLQPSPSSKSQFVSVGDGGPGAYENTVLATGVLKVTLNTNIYSQFYLINDTFCRLVLYGIYQIPLRGAVLN